VVAWRNWGRSAVSRPASVVTPQNEDGIVAVVQLARRHGLPVRAVGSGHSFSPIAVTSGVLVHTTGLSGLQSIDEVSRVAWFGAGTLLGDVARLLAVRGLALENLGDVDRQTLAGAIATGTHGTGMCFPGLSARVVGLRLVLADGSVVQCSDLSRPDLFQAARLGLGAFGVVTAVAVHCVPAFLLQAIERPEPLQNLLEEFDGRMSGADHVEFYWFPHTRTALVKTNRRHAMSDAARAAVPRWRQVWEDEVVNNGLFGAMCYAGVVAPRSIPALSAVATRLVADRQYTDDSTRVFTSPRRVRFREMEYAIPVEAAPDVLREIDALIRLRGWRISFPLEVRVAAADDVWLSMAYGRRTAYVAVHRFHREPFAEYFRAVEDIAVAAGGRPHWGKLHTRRADDLRRYYPRFDEALAVRDRVDPERRFGSRAITRLLGC
jgi:FAD-linked oxidoreductase